MSILTKTQVKNIFVTNAVPQQVDYSNWIDSCVFLNASGSMDFKYLIGENLPLSAVSVPAINETALFFNADDNDYLTKMDDAGNVIRVEQNKYASFSFSSNYSPGQIILFRTKRDITIISINVTLFGLIGFDFELSKYDDSGLFLSPTLIVNNVSYPANSSSGDSSTHNPTPLVTSVSANSLLIAFVTSIVNSGGRAIITVEYKEV